MWESTQAWSVDTKDGPLTFLGLRENEDYEYIEHDSVRSLSVDSKCEACTFPGGGANWTTKQTDDGKRKEVSQPYPAGESRPCERSATERGRCEGIRLIVSQMLHDDGKCNPLRCHVCAGRGGASIQPGQTIVFRGLVSRFVDQMGIAVPVPAKYIGLYLCKDALGVCFEVVSVEDGPTGRRMWLTASGYFCEDLADDDKAQLESGKRKQPTGIILAGANHPLGSG